ncbi:MAG TPA: hypothetical protein VIR31_00535 [Nitrososphaeraceae archaeon]
MKDDDVVVAVKGEKNPLWRGNGVSCGPLHVWIKRNWPDGIPKTCSECHLEKKLQLCNISQTYNPQTYNRDFSNWRFLCFSCHKRHGMTEEWRKNIAAHKHMLGSYREQTLT